MADEEIIVALRAEFGDIKKGFDDFKKQVNVGSKEISKSSKSMGTAFDGVGQRLQRLVMIAGGAIAAFASFRAIVNQLNSIDGLAKTADRLGLATEELQVMRHAAGLAGMSAGALDNAMRFMLRSISEAAQGAGEASKSFAHLGVNIEDLRRMRPDEAFAVISEAMKGIENVADRTALAMRVFGRSGAESLNLIAGGADAITKARDDLTKAGGLITREEAAMIEQANDALRRAKLSFDAVTMSATVGLSPAIEFIATQFTELVGGSGELKKTFLDVGNVGVRAFAYISDGVNGLRLTWNMMQAASDGFVAGVLESTREIVKFYGNLSAGISEIWNRLKNWMIATWDVVAVSVVRAWTKTKQLLMTLMDSLMQGIGDLLYGMGNVAGTVSSDYERELIGASMKVRRAFKADISSINKEMEDMNIAYSEAGTAYLSAQRTMFSGLTQNMDESTQATVDNLNLLAVAARETSDESSKAFWQLAAAATPSEGILEAWEVYRVEAAEKLNAIIQNSQAKAKEHADALADINAEGHDRIDESTERSLAHTFRANEQFWRQINTLWSQGVTGQIKTIGMMTETVSTILGNFSMLMETENRKMFQIGKAASIAKATVDTIRGATSAFMYCVDSFGWPWGVILGAAAAGSVTAAGMANVSKIASTNFGGGGGASAAMPGMGASAGAFAGAGSRGRGQESEPASGPDTPEQRRQIDITLQGSMFSGQQVRELISALNEQFEDGATLALNVR